MPIRKITDVSLGSITTSRILSITSAETVVRVDSGTRAVELNNLGTFNVYYGQSGVLVNSGGVIVPNGAKFWDSIVGDWTVYLVVASGGVTGRILYHGYAGN